MTAPRCSVAAALLVTILLAACNGDGDGGDAGPTATFQSTDAPAPTATAEAPQVAVPNTAPADLTLDEGFTAYAIADGFTRATSIALAPGGAVFVSERHGNIFRLVDADGDGVFEENALFASGFDELTGIVFADDGTLYASSRGTITTLRDTDGDGAADEQQTIVSGLPVGRHQNDGLVFGPDGLLYFDIGSTCDDCVEPDPRSASIVRMNPDGTGFEVYATGHRNVYDLVWDSQGRLWATDNGSDEPCETVDELNLIVQGGDYGWPYGQDGCDPFNDGIPPVASLGLHTASTGVDVYEASHFPELYRGNLFTTLWGSLFAVPEPYGQVLVRVAPQEGVDQPTGEMELFASGFRHPIDVLVDRDGTLLVLDYGEEGTDALGVLYRIVYGG